MSAQFPPELNQKYIIGELISHGAYGEVYNGYYRNANMPVAIKCINIFDDSIDTLRCLREICIMSKISHPNIVKMIDLYIGPPNCTLSNFSILYVVMECMITDMRKMINLFYNSQFNLEDRSALFLKNFCSSITADKVWQIIRQIVDALEYLDDIGIVHRDIKPGNILLDFDFNVKICDFGHAKPLYLGQMNTKSKLPGQAQNKFRSAQDALRLDAQLQQISQLI